MNGVLYVEKSHNTKLGKNVSTTYASIEKSCSTECELKDKGCYAQTSYVGMVVNKLEKQAKKFSALQLARNESTAIDSAKIKDYLRLHVSGDSKTIKGTRLLGSAVNRWLKRGGKKAWSYTHSWKNVNRKHWKNVSVLASISSVKDISGARKQGYAPALVISDFPSNKMFSLEGTETKFIPCPAQTQDDMTCDKCKACFNADLLFQKNYGIAFEVHGIRKNTLKKHLKVIQ